VAAELQRRGELLEAANKELEAFSYSVSHDLRAPLRHIDGYASLLSKAAGGALNDKASRYLQTISDSAKQMGQLIDDLLVFSRMGRQEMLHTTVNLDQLVKTILYDLRLDLQGRTISWTIEPLPEVPGDPAMLRQVFMNLITNAIKFTSTRPSATIEIGVDRSTSAELIVFVRDNGVGFDMQYVGKLFGVFQRLHRVDEFEGTGIGLANVRRIVHRHGGRTWAEGVPGKGATFFVALPTRRPCA
jgi:light-regulated signal transduction histidine kinase (bacteriophytochrome)